MVPILLVNQLYSFRHQPIQVERLCINSKPLDFLSKSERAPNSFSCRFHFFDITIPYHKFFFRFDSVVSNPQLVFS